jgi:hypothetical protein
MRRATTSRWASVNPILLSGEIGYDTILKKAKVGDGVTPWSLLDYFSMSSDTPDPIDFSDPAIIEEIRDGLDYPNITSSTENPSGGEDGDIWFVYS